MVRCRGGSPKFIIYLPWTQLLFMNRITSVFPVSKSGKGAEDAKAWRFWMENLELLWILMDRSRKYMYTSAG